LVLKKGSKKRRPPAHGLGGIGDKVRRELAEAMRVDPDRGEPVGELEDQGDPAALQGIVEPVDDLPPHVVERHLAALERVAVHHRAGRMRLIVTIDDPLIIRRILAG